MLQVQIDCINVEIFTWIWQSKLALRKMPLVPWVDHNSSLFVSPEQSTSYNKANDNKTVYLTRRDDFIDGKVTYNTMNNFKQRCLEIYINNKYEYKRKSEWEIEKDKVEEDEIGC